MGYVYKITNTINGKSYIGISIHEPEKRRIKDHLSGHGNQDIADDINIYGKDAFTYEILEANVFDELVPDLEVAYIASFNTVAPHGYNQNSGGSHAIPSEETRRKMSEANKGKKRTPHTAETKQKISEANRGKIRTPETRHKLSEANKGKTHSEETRRKLSKAHKGKTLSEKTRRKMSEAQRGRTISEEHRRKISETLKGRTHLEETRRKLSEARKGEKNYWYGKTHSLETRQKISESLKGKMTGEKNPNFGKPVSKETRQKISEANKGRKPSKKARQKMSEAHKGKKNPFFGKTGENHPVSHPDYVSVQEYFFSLPPAMSLRKKRQLIYSKFPSISDRTIRGWVQKWALTT